MKKWKAIYLPATSQHDPSKGGFNSCEEAWAYASQHFCSDCKLLFYNNEGSSCDAEWIIDEED
jgi:hypothetical protein